MDECLLRLARAARELALDDVIVTASVCDSMIRGREGPSIVRMRGRTSIMHKPVPDGEDGVIVGQCGRSTEQP